MGALSSSVIIVTGAARGIGRCTAETLCSLGASVVVADILVDEAMQVAGDLIARGYDALGVRVDITDVESVRVMTVLALERFGRIDGLVNNAGIDAPDGDALAISADDWRLIIDVDLSGAWWCTQAVLPTMVAQGSGKIVNISSLAARLGGSSFSPAYATAKAGLIGLTVALSSQLEGRGIRVNAVTPGATGDTGTPFTEAGRKAYLADHPLGFMGAQPVADAVAYLMGASGDFLSGTVVNVSAGEHRGI